MNHYPLNRIALTALAGVLLLFLVRDAAAQSILERLERQLNEVVPPQPAPAATPDHPGYLGMSADETAGGSDASGSRGSNSGVRVVSVAKQGPAETAGMRPGDRIIAVNGSVITSTDDLANVMQRARAGDRMIFEISRSGRRETIPVRLGLRPDTRSNTIPPASRQPGDETATDGLNPQTAADAAAGRSLSGVGQADVPDSKANSAPPLLAPPDVPASGRVEPGGEDLPDFVPDIGLLPAPADRSSDGSGRGILGVTILPISEQARQLYGLAVRSGALINSVTAGSPADLAGLRVGNAIVAVDGRRIVSPADLTAQLGAMRPGQRTEITYFQGNRMQRVNARLASGQTTGQPSPVPVPREAARPQVGPLLGDAPALRTIESILDRFVPPTDAPAAAPPQVEPHEDVALLKAQIEMLERQVEQLQRRIRQLERVPGSTDPR